MSDLTTIVDEAQVIERTITLTNQEWSILSMSVESYTTTVRQQQSEFVTTYVTRGQLNEAVKQAGKMNAMLAILDKIQAKL